LISLAGVGRYALIGLVGDASFLGSMTWISIEGEQSLATWWTSVLWACLALLFFEAGYRKLAGRPIGWILLGAGSILLSIDEAVMIHEQFAALTGRWFGYVGGIWATAWVVFAVPIVVACLAATAPLLIRLPRGIALRLLLSGAVFVTGAVGLEMAFGSARVDFHLPHHHIVILSMHVIEETLEMLGVGMAAIVMLAWLASPTAYMRESTQIPGNV
jgi:hypothetical protein